MEFKTQAFTVSDLYNWYKSGELFLQPKFQRRKIWKPIAKSYLIDTVLRGLPMPKIYYRMLVDPKTVKSVREVVDGQQRLDALFAYIDGGFPLNRNHHPIAAGKRFGQLTESVQSQVLSYDVSADLLIGADDAQVLQIFARINSYSLVLNDQEKRNAKYFGLFKQLAYDLGTSHVAFWTTNKILTEHAIARMAEAELTSELLVGLIAGHQDKKKSLAKYYELYEDNFPSQRDVRSKFERTVSWISENAEAALKGTILTRRTMFYSLFLAVADSLFGIPGGRGPIAGLPKRSLSEKQQAGLRAAFREITAAARADRAPAKWAEFVLAAAQQTDNIRPRQIRHNHLFNILSAL